MTSTPEWFETAITASHTLHEVQVPGASGVECCIRYLFFPRHGCNQATTPGQLHPSQLVFVHGGSAHAHWWSHLIPFFLDAADAVSINLGGMGTSDHRPAYAMDTYVDELCAVSDDAGFTAPLLISHSFGGFVAAAAVARYPKRFAGVILVDSCFRPVGEEIDYASGLIGSLRKRKIYRDLETIRSRFRVVPGPEPRGNGFILEHFFKHAVQELAEGGYMWRYDENRTSLGILYSRRYLEQAVKHGVPFSMVWAEHSGVWAPRGTSLTSPREAALLAVNSSSLAYMRRTLPPNTPVVCLPEATHHCMVDQPLALVSALRSLVQDKRFSQFSVISSNL